MSRRVLGVNACKPSWVGIALTNQGFAGAYIDQRIDELVAAAEEDGALAVVAIDMPIGLSDTGPRQVDVLARRFVGSLRSSVFVTPVRATVEQETYSKAAKVRRTIAGVGALAAGVRLVFPSCWKSTAGCGRPGSE
jgi:predicted RNase H-like nuclease